MAFSILLCCIENVLFTEKSRSYKLLALVSGVSERLSLPYCNVLCTGKGM